MINFDAHKHVYYNNENVIYDSPSKILKKYKGEFNERQVAERYALKHGQTPEYWIEQWRIKRDTSCERGTEIHEYREENLYDLGVERVGDRFHHVRNADIIVQSSLSDLVDGVYPELLLWNHERRISGITDKAIIETVLKKRYAHLQDYKTNKSIDKVSYYFKRTQTFKMMKAPVDHLMDCNYNHYALQFSFYQFMLEEAGFIPGKRTLIHIPHPIRDEQGNVIYQPADVPYTIPYLREEVLLILEHYNARRRTELYKH